MKTIRGLVNELVKREGLKKQVEVAQVREIIGHLSDVFNEQFIQTTDGLESLVDLLVDNGTRRAVKRIANIKKAKKKCPTAPKT